MKKGKNLGWVLSKFIVIAYIENYPEPQVFKFLKMAVKLKVQIVTRTTRN